MSDTQERRQCHRCLVNLRIELFKMKRDDTYQKNCRECNKKSAAYRRKQRHSNSQLIENNREL